MNPIRPPATARKAMPRAKIPLRPIREPSDGGEMAFVESVGFCAAGASGAAGVSVADRVAGIVAAGIGSKLITSDLLKAKDYGGIEQKVRDTIALIKKIRGK